MTDRPGGGVPPRVVARCGADVHVNADLEGDVRVDVVVPTVGRPSLGPLLARLGGFPGRIIVVDDRVRPSPPLTVPAGVEVLPGRARGPAAARNDGWRRSSADWVAFLDDDVAPGDAWAASLADDLGSQEPAVAGSQGRISVPLPVGRRRTDEERNVAGLERARWATADLAYRRTVLASVGGFDERFPRAYREDADLGLRISEGGWRIDGGRRVVVHPVRVGRWWASVVRQRGNSDDALMRRLHGRDWRQRAGAPPGRFRRHVLTTAALMTALVAAGAGHRRTAAVAGAGWVVAVGEFAWSRIAPGPRRPAEVTAMVSTSLVLPPMAVGHRLFGEVRAARLARRSGPLDAEVARAGAGGPGGSPAGSPHDPLGRSSGRHEAVTP